MKEKAQENIKEGINEVEKLWSSFKKYFWILFAIKIFISYGLVRMEAWVNFVYYTLNLNEEGLLIADFVLVLIPVILMVYIMGYYAYKISGEKKKMLIGVFGALWIGIVLIFIGYLLIKRERDNKFKIK